MANKPKHRGVGYVASILRKYASKRYPSNNSATIKAREVIESLKGTKATVKSVMSLIRKKRVGKYVPTLPKELTSIGQNYFRLVDYPNEIMRDVDKRIKFVYYPKYGVVPKDLPPIEGGSDPDYQTYFSPFVNFCNDLKLMTSEEEKAYEEDWFVRCSEPDPITFESRIFSCDKHGVETDYGFDNTTPTKKPEELIQKEYKESDKKEEKKDETKVEKPTTDKTTSIEKIKAEKEVELAKIQSQEQIRIKEAKIQSIEKMFDKGKITFEQYIDAIGKV